MTLLETVVLYRPVGEYELDLIRQSNFERFPARLPNQPIFYPVVTEDYAVRIARDWNTKDPRSGYVGYVVRFRVRKAYLDQYEPQYVGGKSLCEYWIPTEKLDEFNSNIVGVIEVIHEFRAISRANADE